MSRSKNKYEGFSLIEILIVVALIIILATITIIAINPGKNFQDTRNAQRSSDVTSILNAVTQFTSEEGNSIAMFTNIQECPTQTFIGEGDGLVNLKSLLVEEFIVEIPKDPQPAGTDANTGYQICRTASGRVEITAPRAEGGKLISVKR
jgi:type IV pilus assembly protein PilA